MRWKIFVIEPAGVSGEAAASEPPASLDGAPAGGAAGGGCAELVDAPEVVVAGRPESCTRALQTGHTRLLFRSHGSMHFL